MGKEEILSALSGLLGEINRVRDKLLGVTSDLFELIDDIEIYMIDAES